MNSRITSDYVFWVDIPDFLFGLSALLVGWLLIKEKMSDHMLMAWNLVGTAIVLTPTFGFMHYFMNQPGFIFIFEFPMVLHRALLYQCFFSIPKSQTLWV